MTGPLAEDILDALPEVEVVATEPFEPRDVRDPGDAGDLSAEAEPLDGNRWGGMAGSGFVGGGGYKLYPDGPGTEAVFNPFIEPYWGSLFASMASFVCLRGTGFR